MEIIKTLKSFRIPAQINNLNPDIGQDTDAFFMSLDNPRKSLLLNSKGRVEVLDGNSKLRQVILKVTESARVIKMDNSYATFRDRSHAIARFRMRYNTPDSTRFTYHKTTHTLVARAPATTTYFLVGFDEQHMFISELPEPVRTVAEAHNILIPKEIRGKSYVRQGEFFFVPLTTQESKELFKKARDNDLHSPEQIMGSDHEASFMVQDDDDNEYVMGKIGNERHELYLDRMHRVYRNREVEREGRFWD